MNQEFIDSISSLIHKGLRIQVKMSVEDIKFEKIESKTSLK